MGITRGTISTQLWGVLWASKLDQAQPAAELWHRCLAYSCAQGGDMHLHLPSQDCTGACKSRPAAVKGIFQHKNRVWGLGGSHLERGTLSTTFRWLRRSCFLRLHSGVKHLIHAFSQCLNPDRFRCLNLDRLFSSRWKTNTVLTFSKTHKC